METERKFAVVPKDEEQIDAAAIAKPEGIFESYLDRIGKMQKWVSALGKDISMNTPFVFEQNRDEYLNSIKQTNSQFEQLEQELSMIRSEMEDSYPTFTWSQRMLIIWASYRGRGLDEIRIRQLWTYKPTKERYFRLCDEIKANLRTQQSRNAEALKFARTVLTDEMTADKISKLKEEKRQYMEDNISFLNLLNTISEFKFKSLEEIQGKRFSFNGYIILSNSVELRILEHYTKYLNQTPPNTISRTMYIEFSDQCYERVKKTLDDYDRKITQTKKQITMEVDKQFL